MAYNEKILHILGGKDELSSLEFASQEGVPHQTVVGSIKSLQALGDVIQCEEHHSSHVALTAEGEHIVEHGSHEIVIFKSISPEGVLHKDLMSSSPYAKIGFSKAMANSWIKVDKSAENGPKIYKNVESVEDVTQECLLKIKHLQLDKVDVNVVKDLKKRKLIQDEKVTYYIVKKGPNFSLTVEKEETELTEAMLVNGSWKEKKFKMLSYDVYGVPPPSGYLHPLLKVRSEFRRILMDMGFSEMPTNNYVESSFWNFDALFQPQQHPARDAHDTFFLSDPATCEDLPADYVERVRQVHSKGGYGSSGYQYDWRLEEAQKNILRTHTTAVSARMLYKLAHEKPFQPKRYFSIDRVFRNESLDATHLAEFHQIEGLVADVGLTLGDLKGVIHEFFLKLGLRKLRFKPAYNPYTEPSMEIFSYHEGLKRWIEVGNSGMFRPEMLEPMGLPPDVVVIAWGLSLERPTMIKYGYQNIRDLIGPKVDLQMVYDSPLCRLDKM